MDPKANNVVSTNNAPKEEKKTEGKPEGKRANLTPAPPPSKQPKHEASDSSGGEDEEFDPDTQSALEEIDATQNEIDGLNEKASDEILTIEQKYNKMRKPFFDKRGNIISRISGFWVTAMTNHPQLSCLIGEEEEDCLRLLTKLEVEEYDDIKSGFEIRFHFGVNPFFENQVLVKEFHLGSEPPKCVVPDIKWKDGNNLAKKYEVDSNGRKRKRPFEDGFFKWILDDMDPSSDHVAETIKEDLWPNPLQYFLIPDYDQGGEDGGDEEEDDDDQIEIVEEEEEMDVADGGEDEDLGEEEEEGQ